MFDKVFYIRVEAAAFWHAILCATLMRGDGFVPNPYDPCVFNKQGPGGAHATVLMHVDDLFITIKRIENHARLEKCMRNKYNEIKNNTSKVVDYIGMTFDFIIPGHVSIHVDNCERSILSV